MQMPDNREFDLAESIADDRFAREEWERGGVMAEENDTLFRGQFEEGIADLVQVLLSFVFPLGAFGRERFRFENGQGQE